MTEVNVYEQLNESLFELNSKEFLAEYLHKQMERAAQQVIDLGAVAMQFSEIKRVPRYTCSSRENDAEHSFMLSLISADLAGSYFPDLSPGLAAQFSNVHDLVELETGDVATFMLNDSELAAKEATELSAVNRVAARLPLYSRDLFIRYEQQKEPEARFVRLVDKILPNLVNILGSGIKVMNEDYGVTSLEVLDQNENRVDVNLRQRFPETELDFIHGIRVKVAENFSRQFSEHIATS